MKQQAASHHQGDDGLAPTTSPDAQLEHGATPHLVLTEDQLRVLDCMRRAGGGLTARQIGSRSACSGEALETALAALVEQKLVARLNTIIPSYAARESSGR